MSRRTGVITSYSIHYTKLYDTDIIKKGSPDVDIAHIIFRRKDFAETLPWDFIDAGVDRERLWEEYGKALSA